MTAPLEDKTEAQKRTDRILTSILQSGDVKVMTTVGGGSETHVMSPKAMFSTAIRETHAAELAEAVEELVEFIRHGTSYELENFQDYKTPQKAIAALAKFKEIANAG